MRRTGLLIVESALVVGVLALGRMIERPAPRLWMRTAPDAAAMAALWWITVTLVAWLAVSILFAVVAELPGVPPALRRAARRLSPRLVRSLLVGGLAVSGLAPPALAATDDVGVRSGRSPAAPVTTRTSTPVTTNPTTPTTTAPPTVPPGPASPSPLVAQAPPTPTSGPTVGVVAGDNLWSIATRRVEAQLGRTPNDAEIAPLWRRIVDANRGRVRSGNPSLIYPGEEIVIPDETPEGVR